MIRIAPLVLLAIPIALIAADPKAKAAKQPDDVRAALDELGIVRKPKIVLAIPAGYAADEISVEVVRKEPKKYPLRAAVLRAAEVLKPARAVIVVEEFKSETPKAKEAFKAKQLPLAAMIDDLGESLADLQKLESERANEPSKRWKAHYDFILAETMYRFVVLNEINKAYAQVLVDQLPEPKGDAKRAVWKLVPAEKLASGRELREQMTAARGKLTAIVRDFKSLGGSAPWYYLVEELVEKPAGLQWLLVEPKE
jgi:hypothetical protein